MENITIGREAAPTVPRLEMAFLVSKRLHRALLHLGAKCRQCDASSADYEASVIADRWNLSPTVPLGMVELVGNGGDA
jgi:hypothetical protein